MNDLIANQTPTPDLKKAEDAMLCADLKDSVASEIGHSVPEVQAVFASFKESSLLHVWAVVPEYDRAVYRRDRQQW